MPADDARERAIAEAYVRECSRYMGPYRKRDLQRAIDEVTKVLVGLRRAQQRAKQPRAVTT